MRQVLIRVVRNGRMSREMFWRRGQGDRAGGEVRGQRASTEEKREDS